MELFGVGVVVGLVLGTLWTWPKRNQQARLSLKVLKAAYQAGKQEGVRQTLLSLAVQPRPEDVPPKMN